MRTIYKYPLKIQDRQLLQIPFVNDRLYGSLKLKQQILKLDVQNENPCLWVLVDTDLPRRDVVVNMYGTGHSCHETIDQYVDSFQHSPHGISTFVFLVFVNED